MSQVIIVSNRLPISVKKVNAKFVYSPSLGGLATGLSSYVNDQGNIWIGWPGIASDELSENDKQQIATKLGKRNCYPVFLSQKQIDEYYNGYSNSVLWPLFHNLPGQHISPDRKSSWWQTYRKVNQHFAEVIINLAQPKNQIWIHDYQLLLLPLLLRSEQTVSNIGFFLHIPFPDAIALSSLTESKKLLNGMLGANLIGFHTTNYVHNFLDYCKIMNLGSVSDSIITLPSHTVQVSEFPMGIDYQKYAQASKTKEVKQAAKRFKKRYRGRKLIVSVDRLDPTKGLIERLIAYSEYLKRNPKQHGKVVFAMVAAPSRTEITVYKKLTKRLQELSSEINRSYGTFAWQPVDYIDTPQSFENVAALFRIADVAFIVPLRDGMNLVAKEFIASSKRRGVLILSETAGAAEELQDALLVDPGRPESLVEALEQAMSMHKRELRARLKHMKKDLSINTVHRWAKTFVETMQKPIPGTPHWTRSLNKRLSGQLYADFHKAKKRLLLLDYDGTLVPFSAHHLDAKPPKVLIRLLEQLSADPKNELVLSSGRSAENLQDWFGAIPINLVAEHGAIIKKSHNKNWHEVEKSNTNWKNIILPTLKRYTGLTPGARIEIKQNSLAWHYRAAKPYQAQKYAVIIRRTLGPFLKTYGLELLQGNKVLEIKNPRISKASAARQWIDQDYPFVLSIGDDVTDETLFLTLPDNCYGIKVGRGRTAARFRVASNKEAITLLRKLTRL